MRPSPLALAFALALPLALGCGGDPPPPAKAPSAGKPSSPPRPPRPSAAPLTGGSSDGTTCEQAIDKNNEELAIGKKQDNDLSTNDLGAVLNNGAYLAECDVPASARVSVCAAVKEGHAVGVTVAVSPSNPDVEKCVSGKVRTMGFPIHKKLHVARTTFE